MDVDVESRKVGLSGAGWLDRPKEVQSTLEVNRVSMDLYITWAQCSSQDKVSRVTITDAWS